MALTEWPGQASAWVGAPPRPAGSGGLLLLDSAGRVRACDPGFDLLAGGADAMSDMVTDAIFPAGFRPRELIFGAEPDRAKHCNVTIGGRIFPAAIQLHSIQLHLNDSGWIVAIELKGERKADQAPTAELGFLRDQLAIRSDIARYLHDTVCQDLVALSLSLAGLRRELSLGSNPGFSRAIELSDTCSRGLRVLNDSLAPPVMMADDPKADDFGDGAAAALEWYLIQLREDSGIDVRFEATGCEAGGPAGMDTLSRALICGAVQQWAGTAINQKRTTQARPAATRIHLLCLPARFELEFFSSLPDDPAIDAVLSSVLIRECARGLGGDLEKVPVHAGSSARLLMLSGGAVGGRPLRAATIS